MRQARERCGDGGFLPCFLDDCRCDRLPHGDSTADEIVEHSGIDRFRWTAPCQPHPDAFARLYDAVHVRRIRLDAEVACGGALEEKPRRGAEFRRDRVAFVAPSTELARDREIARDAIDR